MSFWDSSKLPTYNLKGGFMLPANAFMSDFTPGGTFLNLPQPATSTSAPTQENSSDQDKAVTNLVSNLSDSESSEEKGFISNLWSKIIGDSSESDDERSVSTKSEVCSPCSPTDVNRGDDCKGCDGWFKKAQCNVSKLTKDCDKKDIKNKYLKYKKKYFKAKYNIDL